MQAQSSHGELPWLLLGVASKLLLATELSMKRMASYTATLTRCKVIATPQGVLESFCMLLHGVLPLFLSSLYFERCHRHNQSQVCGAAHLTAGAVSKSNLSPLACLCLYGSDDFADCPYGLPYNGRTCCI